MAEVTFGEWLRRRRKTLGLTQADLARQVHCSVSAIRKFEAEQRRPSEQIVEQLIGVFTIPPEEREPFLKFARGDWGSAPTDVTEDSPWQISHPPQNNQLFQNNLPVQLSSFIGREQQIADITSQLRSTRLLTLTGPGGTGKTRLSIQAALNLLNQYPDGVWMVELAPILDPLLVPRTTAIAIGLRDEPRLPIIEVLSEYMREKKMLILLDNCEHLVEACAQLAHRLLRSSPQLRILATSREALGITGETTFLVPPLKLPNSQNIQVINRSEAIRLFVERASDAVHNFSFSDENASSIARICSRLDGIPLAIELAAAKTRVLSVDQIARRLDDSFRLLTGGSRTSLKRHQTLRAAVDWSYDLLSSEEQVLFRRLSVFVDGWTLKAAESVCSFEIGPNESPDREAVRGENILELMEQLVNKSMVFMKDEHGKSRYHMLEILQQYAHEKLVSSGERDTLHDAHLEYFLDLAETAEPYLRRTEQTEWLAQLDADYRNIRAALGRGMDKPSAETSLRMTAALGPYWELRDYWLEGSKWLDQALEKDWNGSDRVEKTARAKSLYRRAYNAFALDELDISKKSAESALELCEQVEDRWGTAYVHGLIAYYLKRTGFFDESRRFFEQSLAEFKDLQDAWGESLVLRWWLAFYVPSEQREEYSQNIQRMLDRARISGDRYGIADSLILSAHNLYLENKIDESEAMLNEAEKLSAKFGSTEYKFLAHHVRYQISFVRGDLENAKKHLDSCIEHFHQIGEKNQQGVLLISRALISEFENDLPAAIDHAQKGYDLIKGLQTIGMTTTILFILGRLNYQLGNIELANQFILEGLNTMRDTTRIGKEEIVYVFCHLGGFLVERNAESAAKVLALSESLSKPLPIPRDLTWDIPFYERFLSTAREKLSEAEFTFAWEAGSKLTLKQAVELAWRTVKET